MSELNQFRVDAAKWQQDYEDVERQLKERETEVKELQRKIKESPPQHHSGPQPRVSITSSISSEPSTPSSSEMYLELVAKISDYEQVRR